MSDLQLIVTDAGRAALVNAPNTGTAAVTIASVGFSAQSFAHGPATTVLPNEIKRVATISGDVVADDTIHLIVSDDSETVYTVRSFALYLTDGTLFAVYSQAGIIIEKSAMALLLLAIDVRLANIAASQITFGNADFLNPPATTTTSGVVELATPAEVVAGTDERLAVTPAGVKAAVNAGKLGFTPVRQGGGAGQLVNNVSIGWSNTGLKAQVDVTDLGVFVFRSDIADVWRASNDGAGSGLDADMLDGREGSWYADIAARLGFTPANRAGENFAGDVAVTRAGAASLSVNSIGAVIARLVAQPDGNVVLYRGTGAGDVPIFGVAGATGPFLVQMPISRAGNMVWDAGNDGAGSGADADLLDGQQGAWYTDIAGRQGFTSANRAGDTFTGPVKRDAQFYLDMAGDSPIINFNPNRYLHFNRATDTFSVVLAGVPYLSVNGSDARFAGNVIWHAANDGAGSGLDADLLDGQQGNWYTDIAARLGFTPANRAGENFTGDVSVTRAGSAGLSVNSAGAVIARLVAQGDGNVVLYRNNGGGDVPILSGDGATVNIGAPLLRQGGKVWDVGNDGAGSGLDADLLDGRDGGWYADIIARLGFTPANAAGQIFGGPIGPEDGFRMVFSEGNPGIQFTADGKTSVFYNRNTRYFTFYVADRAVFDVDANGNARFRGSVTQNYAF